MVHNNIFVQELHTLNGSKGSGGGGFASVLTAQNMHPRVQVSPSNMIVAVAVPWLPPQHSPTLGHCASFTESGKLESKLYNGQKLPGCFLTFADSIEAEIGERVLHFYIFRVLG